MNLEELRTHIDMLDEELLRLLQARFELALRTGKFKPSTQDSQRETQVLENAVSKAPRLVEKEFAKKLFEDILLQSRHLQQAKPVLVGFQGEHGAYSEVAVESFFPQGVPLACPEFSDVFSLVESGQLDFGVVPVENSLEGAVTAVNDLLVSTPLRIVGEAFVPVHHALLALSQTDYRDIKTVYSHPQALAQCRGFIERNKLEARPFFDTAGAAQMLARERPKAAAAIASTLAAKLYGLEILKENIEDHASNSTRFLVLSREPASGKGNKCSIIFTTAHKAGALYAVLDVFSKAGINLTRIESRPLRESPSMFAFLLDFQGNDQEKTVKEAMEKLKTQTTWLKFLGCYTEGEKT